MQSNIQIRSFRHGDLYGQCRELLHAGSGGRTGRALEDVFSELLKELTQNIPFDHLGIGLFNPRLHTFDVLLQAGKNEFLSQVPVSDDAMAVVVEQCQSIEVSDVDAELRALDLVQLAKSGDFRSFRVVPLGTGQRVLGILAIFRKYPGNFSDNDRRRINHAAQLVALVLENAMMADVLALEKSRLETLLDLNHRLISSLDMQNIFQEVSGLLRKVLNQDYTYLTLYDKEKDSMAFYVLESGEDVVVRQDTPVPVSECPSGIAYKRGEYMRFDEAALALVGSQHTKDLLAIGVRSICCFPLVSHGRKFGTLGLATKRDHKPAEEDVALLTQIATQVAMAIDNARAYEEIAKLKDRLSKEKLYLEDEIRSHHNFGEVVGTSPVLCQVLRQVEIAAPSDATVLVLGETGTGKELVARALHRLSSRREQSFIKLNCAAIPTGLLESELFGHEKGAFTGAISQKIGRLELADKGTLFLDEIGEIPMELQPKLLRVLQDQEFERLGGVRTIRVNARVVAATNRDLLQAVRNQVFRSDLYYRLNVFPIHVPPLRERIGDIPMLVRYFVQKFARRLGKNIEAIPVEVIQELERWRWPGNIRELENFLERSVILTQGSVLFAPLTELRVALPGNASNSGTLQEFEREYILRTLRESGGVIAGVNGAAARLGMKRTTLQSRMQRLGIAREEYQV